MRRLPRRFPVSAKPTLPISGHDQMMMRERERERLYDNELHFTVPNIYLVIGESRRTERGRWEGGPTNWSGSIPPSAARATDLNLRHTLLLIIFTLKLYCSYYKCKENRHVNSGKPRGNGGKERGWVGGEETRKLSYERRASCKITESQGLVGTLKPSRFSEDSFISSERLITAKAKSISISMCMLRAPFHSKGCARKPERLVLLYTYIKRDYIRRIISTNSTKVQISLLHCFILVSLHI